ncbi:MAG: ChbG/HpnK family deacetylase [Acidovorax sp.]
MPTPLPDTPRISLCVDDFGLHAGVNQAVLVLARLGRVQATSAMVGAPAWAQGAAELRTLDVRQLEVGLHLDLTEHPLHLPRQNLGPLIARAYLRQLDAAALRAEISAQFDAFERHLDGPPAYVDGHQHVHQLPMVRGLLVQEVARRYPPGTLWLRATHAGLPADPKAQVIAGLGARALSALARGQGLRQNARLLGVYGFTGGAQRYRERLARWLHAARDGDLLMCHPALPAAVPDAIARAREDEFAVLSAPGFDTLLEDARVRLAPMRQILSI